MKIQFPKKTNSEVIDDIKKVLAGRSLGDMVSLEDQGGDLVMKISKLGTSSLTFSRTESADNVTYSLSSEKIAFAHRGFKDEVKGKLSNVIERAGGKVLEA